MIVTKESIKDIPISEIEQRLLNALLDDIEEVFPEGNITLEWISEHTEYSPERVDPCPDYYGLYRVYHKHGGIIEDIGTEMDIHELDNALCLLCNYVEQGE